MNAERSNLGFLVYRIDGNGKQQISPDVILGSAARSSSQTMYGEQYSFFDKSGSTGSVYFVETINMNGQRFASQTVTTKYVTEADALGQSLLTMEKKTPRILNSRFASSQLVIPSELSTIINSNIIAPDINTHRWVISQPGVRIGVRREGIYRVNRSELQAQGFNVNSDPALWQLYKAGVQQAIIIGGNGDYLEFYGNGVDTVESDLQMYYLIVGADNGKRMSARVVRPSLGTAISSNYDQSAVRKERTSYVNDIINGDPENYWGRVVFSSPTTYVFSLSGVDFSKANSNIKVDLQGFSGGIHNIRILLNGNNLGTVDGDGRNPYTSTFSIPTAFLVEGANNLQMTAVGPSGDISFFDNVSVNYGRKYQAEQNRLSFVSPSLRVAMVDGFASPNFRLFDVTYDGNPSVLTNFNAVQNGNTFGVNLPGARSRLMFGIDDSAVLAAASITPNDTSVLTNPAINADLVIISYKGWLAQAETWANYRRSQGFTVRVVDVDKVYDEFNYGVLSADSIKSFLNYAYSNWATPPRYVLLLGDASYDSRNYEGYGYLNLVPTRIVNTIYSETGSDEALSDFDGDGLSEIAIGRISARDAQTVTNALAKVMAFEQPALQSLSRGALFAFDEPRGYDFQGMSNRLQAQLQMGATIPATQIYRFSTNAQTNLVNEMNTGKYVVNYSGHGSTGVWASSSFFGTDNVPQLTNASNISIYTMLTCLNGYFLNTVNKSLAESLVDATNGGAVAAWASSGLTTADIQELMATRFYQQLGVGNITRMGDLIRDAKTVIPGGSDVRLSWALIGDPMLKVR